MHDCKLFLVKFVFLYRFILGNYFLYDKTHYGIIGIIDLIVFLCIFPLIFLFLHLINIACSAT